MQRSQTGATGRPQLFTPPPRAESWAFFKKKKELKLGSFAAYALDRGELEQWLSVRFPTVTAIEMQLKLVCSCQHHISFHLEILG